VVVEAVVLESEVKLVDKTVTSEPEVTVVNKVVDVMSKENMEVKEDVNIVNEVVVIRVVV
jgi:hypothetical protein